MTVRNALVAGVLLALATNAGVAATFHTALPAATRKPEVRAARDKHIEKYRRAYLEKARRGELGRASSAKRAAEQKIRARALRLRDALARQKDDRPILVIVEGRDGVGKSSTIRRLALAFEGVKEVAVTHFGAPPPDAEDVHAMKRFFDALPRKGQVMFWDRSYLGRVVYDPYYGLAGKKQVKQSLREIRHFEGLLMDKVRVAKLYLPTSGKRLAKTIAKREVTAPEKLGDNDYLVYRDRKQIRKLFEKGMRATSDIFPWYDAPMDDRAEGRLELFDVLERVLVGR